jgi:hypothetical protein
MVRAKSVPRALHIYRDADSYREWQFDAQNEKLGDDLFQLAGIRSSVALMAA